MAEKIFFPDPEKKEHSEGKGIVGYYPALVEERCKKVYALQEKGLYHFHDKEDSWEGRAREIRT